MTTETIENNEVAGYVCPSCRMVFSAPREIDGSGVACPGCGVLLRIPPKNGTIKEIEVVEKQTEIPLEADTASKPSKRKKQISHTREDEFGSQDSLQGGDFSLKLIVPVLVFSLLILGAIGYLFLRPTETTPVIVDTGPENIENRIEEEVGPSLEKEEQYRFDEDDEAHVERVEAFISEWHSAVSVDEKLKFVRPVEGIREKMEHYYKSFPDSGSKLKTVRGISNLVTVSGYIAYSSQTEDYKNHSGLIKYSKDSMLLDWESYVSYSDMTFDELAEKKPTEPVRLRVIATVGNYYNNNFSDETKWKAVKLENLNEENVIYGYVALNSANEQRIFSFGNNEQQSLIVDVFYLPNEENGNQVMIDKVVQNGWLEQ